MRPLFKKSWFKAGIGIIILCLLFISFLPVAIRYGIERWYLQQDIDAISIRDIDLNLFTGELHLKEITAHKDDNEVLALTNSSVDFDWLPLLKKRVFLPNISIDGLKARIQQLEAGDILIGGIRLPRVTDETAGADEDDTTPEPWGFGLHNIGISNVALYLQTPIQKADFTIDSIQLDKLESWSDTDTHVDFSGKINKAVLTSTATLRPFTEQPVYEGSIKLEGLDISPLATNLKQHLQGLTGKLSLDTNFRIKLHTDKGTEIHSQGALGLHNLLLKQADNKLALDRLYWQGNTSIQLPAKQGVMSYHLQGKIDSENAEFGLDKEYHYHHDKLNWEGSIKSPGKSASLPQVSGSIHANGLILRQLSNNLELFRSSNIGINELQVLDSNQINTRKISFQEIRALYSLASKDEKRNPALLQAKALQIEHANFTDGNQLKLGSSSLEGALISVIRQKDGRLQQLAALQTGSATEIKPAEKDSVKKKPELNVMLEAFKVSKNSRVKIVDKSVKPAFKSELLIKQARISNIDSSRHDAASPFTINASLDKYSSLHFDGEILPFSDPLTLKFKGKIANVNLPPVSSYTSGFIGYDLRSGQLSADLDANIVKGKLDIDNKITLSNLEVKTSDSKKSESLTKQLSMPLNSALSLLRDKNNDIKLSIPVKGDINKPDFDISDVINKAIGVAMKQASLSYLSHALQPYGSLITLAKLAKTAAEYVSLNPILFSPASSLADNTAIEYSTKIASLMKERPDLKIKLCGIATAQDSQALVRQKQDNWKQKQQQSTPDSKATPPLFSVSDEELLDLALQRSSTIKDILIKNHGINASRLFQCQPSLEQDADSKPRLDLRI